MAAVAPCGGVSCYENQGPKRMLQPYRSCQLPCRASLGSAAWLASSARCVRGLLPAHRGDGDGGDTAHDGGACAQPHQAILQDLLVAGLQQRLCLPELWVHLRAAGRKT